MNLEASPKRKTGKAKPPHMRTLDSTPSNSHRTATAKTALSSGK
jgi:hypothetical protein